MNSEQVQPHCCCCNYNSGNTCCPLCTAALVLPSCVGAIRALQCSFASTTATAFQSNGAHCNRKNCCISSEGKWLPACDSMRITTNTPRCCSC